MNRPDAGKQLAKNPHNTHLHQFWRRKNAKLRYRPVHNNYHCRCMETDLTVKAAA